MSERDRAAKPDQGPPPTMSTRTSRAAISLIAPDQRRRTSRSRRLAFRDETDMRLELRSSRLLSPTRTGLMHASHELNVSVVSPEEAEYGTAEFWAGDRLFGFTRVEDGELVLRIEPQSDGGAVVVNAHSLAEALARAKQLLESQ